MEVREEMNLPTLHNRGARINYGSAWRNEYANFKKQGCVN